ncbi:MAG: cobalt-precorrin-6A reductase [Rhodospirillales bacterium]|nr:cobalt-precorrin-6A reductase [Rhodospirillales bacterium]MBO6788429.1 cobalt-precorrin-6A reductase [Rhodospirillales bacterium]
MARKTVVILGGTAEARRLADALVDERGERLRVITSLAGRTKNPKYPKGEIREGGFGGADGLAAYLEDVSAGLLIDATHPYAAQISRHAAEAAVEKGVPRLLLNRPAWDAQDGDHWIHVKSVGEAVQEISRKSDACLITTGVNDLVAFTPIITTKLFVRLIEKPESLPLQDAEIVIGSPPYRKDDEVALMRMLGIDLMVTKNAGGDATYAKIEAARTLGIEVIMIDRPPLPDGETVTSVDEAARRALEILD